MNILMPGALDKAGQMMGRTALLKKEEPQPARGQDNLDAPMGHETDTITGEEQGTRTRLVELASRILLALAALFAVRRLVRK